MRACLVRENHQSDSLRLKSQGRPWPSRAKEPGAGEKSRHKDRVLSRRVARDGVAPQLGDMAKARAPSGNTLVHLDEETLPMAQDGTLEVVLPLPGSAVHCPSQLRSLYEESARELLGLPLEAFSARLPLDLPLEGVYRPIIAWAAQPGAAPGATSRAVSVLAMPAAAMEVDDDDDWNPVVKPGVVLRPHILQWAGEAPKEGQGAREILEADPLHDPEADDEDQKWVEDRLLQPDQCNVKATDAVLNCPGCFTPVCYQCQRHEQYSGQWRATEVRNCTVDATVAFSMAKDDPTKYHAVRCEVCKADVGLLESHFCLGSGYGRHLPPVSRPRKFSLKAVASHRDAELEGLEKSHGEPLGTEISGGFKFSQVLPRGMTWRRLDASEALELQRRQGRLLLTDRDRLRGGEVPVDSNTRYMEDLCDSGALIMSCVLPPSSYFTMAFRELTRDETVWEGFSEEKLKENSWGSFGEDWD
eukprot:s401_g15.t2